jgi:hypothetical protein
VSSSGSSSSSRTACSPLAKEMDGGAADDDSVRCCILWCCSRQGCSCKATRHCPAKTAHMQHAPTSSAAVAAAHSTNIRDHVLAASRQQNNAEHVGALVLQQISHSTSSQSCGSTLTVAAAPSLQQPVQEAAHRHSCSCPQGVSAAEPCRALQMCCVTVRNHPHL